MGTGGGGPDGGLLGKAGGGPLVVGGKGGGAPLLGGGGNSLRGVDAVEVSSGVPAALFSLLEELWRGGSDGLDEEDGGIAGGPMFGFMSASLSFS